VTEEEKRLEQAREHRVDWKLWGPYLSERAWGTVREDYSADGNAWDYFPHAQACSRAYRWNEDGILGISDRRQYLCFAVALWNGKDPILKERMFGLTNSQGNHGEDVKEYYFFLDNTPTHAYMKGLYKYPQAAFPYKDLVEENGRRDHNEPEYELLDTGVFAENRYYDVFVEYAKADVDDILIEISVVNRGPETAQLDLLPTLWYRNTWAWDEQTSRPQLSVAVPESQAVRAGCERVILSEHPVLGRHWLLCETDGDQPELLFTENETNNVRLFGANCVNPTLYVKDGINDYIVHSDKNAVNGHNIGTKAAARYHLTLQPGETRRVRLRLTNDATEADPLGRHFDGVVEARKQEADDFYDVIAPPGANAEMKKVQRQALAGMLWSKQFYHYAVDRWLDGDPGLPQPPPQRQHGRNCDWRHLVNSDVFSMPDTWEYPWYAAWDLAFHCISLALVDSTFAKRQLVLLCREWSMHPNGELPAYEWAFGDVNPPVHAWAALRVYKIERRITGRADRAFLERIFHKLLLNFTWWVNRKDPEGRNVFQGGFLGLDNIGVFDRSAPLPNGEFLEQSDGTAWMGFFCLSMFAIAVELSREDDVYEDLATKFFEHFLYIASALNNLGGAGVGLWDEEDQFFYDILCRPNDGAIPLKVRSLVGLCPLLAVTTIEQADIDRMPTFKERLNWFLHNRPDLADLVTHWEVPGQGDRRLLALVRTHRMNALLHRMLDPDEFLSDHGIRSLSKAHEQHPYVLDVDGMKRTVDYEPAESRSVLFGGNSNWRGPVWFPVNYLLIEALQRFDYYYGSEYKVECPTGSGQMMTLWQVSQELSRRLIRLFLPDKDGCRPCYGGVETFQNDPEWRDYLLFHEYFHGDNGAGLGASHQTGWTGLVAKLIQQSGA
jgi:hypothetical protein